MAVPEISLAGKELPFPEAAAAIAYADGASRGNPGPASYGCVYALEDGTPLCGEGAVLGDATNNVAEYRGAIAAMERFLQWNISEGVIRLDSQLVVRQMNGQYKVKSPGLKPLFLQAVELRKKFKDLQFEHVPRAENAAADAMANRALDGLL